MRKKLTKKIYEQDDTEDFNIKHDIGGFMFCIFIWSLALLVSAFILGCEVSNIMWKKDAVERGFAVWNDRGFRWIKQ